MKLICLPFAGGSAQSYMEWKRFFGKEIEIISVEYAGHGRRFCENLTDSVEATLKDIYSRLIEHIDQEYALLGHSMGAIYAYELVKLIERDKRRKPVKVIVSGTDAPYVQDRKILHNMPQRELMQEIYALGCMPDEMIENSELSDLFYPILLNDIRNLELYRLEHNNREIDRINIPLTVICGTEDEEFGLQSAAEWQKYSTMPNTIREFEGGHFFIFERKEEVCSFLRKQLLFY